MSDAIYERWDNGMKVTIKKPKIKEKELTPAELTELKLLIEKMLAKRETDSAQE